MAKTVQPIEREAPPQPEVEEIVFSEKLALEMERLDISIFLVGIAASFLIILWFLSAEVFHFPNRLTNLVGLIIMVYGFSSMLFFSKRRKTYIHRYMRFLSAHQWVHRSENPQKLSKELKKRVIVLEKSLGWNNILRQYIRALPRPALAEPLVGALEYLQTNEELWQNFKKLEPFEDAVMVQLSREQKVAYPFWTLLRLLPFSAWYKGWPVEKIHQVFSDEIMEERAAKFLEQVKIKPLAPPRYLPFEVSWMDKFTNYCRRLGSSGSSMILLLIFGSLLITRELPHLFKLIVLTAGLFVILVYPRISSTFVPFKVNTWKHFIIFSLWLIGLSVQLGVLFRGLIGFF